MEDKYKQKYQKYKKKYLTARKNTKTSKNRRGQKGGAMNVEIPDLKVAIDETYFWGKQFEEHAHIFYLGLEAEPLKSKGKELEDKWKSFLKAEFEDKGIVYELQNENHSEIKVSLNEADFAKLGDLSQFNFDKLTELLQETRDYKMQIKDELDKGNWIGWVYPHLVVHLTLELDMYYKRIQGKVKPDEDIAFYVEMAEDHIAITEKLTDPDEENEKLEERMRKLKKNAPLDTVDANEAANYVQAVDQSDGEILKMMLDKIFKGIIPLDFMYHNLREHNRALEQLKKLQNRTKN